MAQQWQMACPVCGAPVWIFLHYIRPTVTHCFSADEYIVFDIPKDVMNAGGREVERWAGEQLRSTCRGRPRTATTEQE